MARHVERLSALPGVAGKSVQHQRRCITYRRLRMRRVWFAGRVVPALSDEQGSNGLEEAQQRKQDRNGGDALPNHPFD